jgi:DNA-directed RNA polymerase subunit K/omega
MSTLVDPSSSDLRALSRGQAAGDSFYVVTLMFQRAKQLKAGARPRVDPRGHTPARVALLEVLAGLVVAAS